MLEERRTTNDREDELVDDGTEEDGSEGRGKMNGTRRSDESEDRPLPRRDTR